MTDTWKAKQLSELSVINYGYTTSASIEPVGPRFLRITDIQDDRVDWETVPYCEVAPADISKYRLETGDIVFARTGATTGKSFLVDNPPEAVCASYLIRLRISEHEISPAFLSLFFQTSTYWQSIKDGSIGSAQGGFNATKLGSLFIPYPPLAEQQRIVAILGEAFAGIATAKANAERNLRNVREAFDSYLRGIFSRKGDGWVSKSIGDIADIKGGKRVPKGYRLQADPTDYPYIRVTDFLESGTIDTSDLRYVSADVHSSIKKYIIRSEDLYISIAGTIGKTGIIPDELDGANLTENACRLVFRKGVSNRYVYYFTTTSDFEAQVGANTRTAAQPKLALSRLSTIRLSLPSIDQQLSLAKDFDRLRDETKRLESIYTRKLTALDELKQSLLHQAFSGQL